MVWCGVEKKGRGSTQHAPHGPHLSCRSSSSVMYSGGKTSGREDKAWPICGRRSICTQQGCGGWRLLLSLAPPGVHSHTNPQMHPPCPHKPLWTAYKQKDPWLLLARPSACRHPRMPLPLQRLDQVPPAPARTTGMQNLSFQGPSLGKHTLHRMVQATGACVSGAGQHWEHGQSFRPWFQA